MTLKPSELLSDASKWCQGAYALDASGSTARPTSDQACQWCALGAIRHCADSVEDAIRMRVILQGVLRSAGYRGDIENFNDDRNRTFDEVREMLLAAGL